MKPGHFFKMSGCGNDFILIDNRDKALDQMITPDFIRKICRRKMSVGADGVILVGNSKTRDFKWRFFNSDGSVAEMCGNGARCAARFAFLNGIAGQTMAFETDAGVIEAAVLENSVKIRMPEPSAIAEGICLDVSEKTVIMSYINTGVPHVVVSVPDIEATDMVSLGREIRFHKRFSPAGTNVNAVCIKTDEPIAVRTYERGVEDETLACGTGAVAAALVVAHQTGQNAPIKIRTRSGGLLTIYFTRENGRFANVWLEGDARLIYRGQLNSDAWTYGEE